MGAIPALKKLTFIAGAAFVATTLSLLLMQLLIATELRQGEALDPPLISTRLQLEDHNRERQEPERKRAEKILPAEPPPVPEGVPVDHQPFSVLVKAERPTFESLADELMDEVSMNLIAPSTDLLPLYIVQPAYPFSAVMKQIEGYVVVNFGVRTNGTVQNPVVVESAPGELFDQAALSAIDKFRFQPRMHLGDPLAATDLQMRFVFSMEGIGISNLAAP